MTRRRGFTLIEIVLAFGLLGVLSLLMVATMRSNLDFSRKMDTAETLDRAVLVSVRFLRNELRGASVSEPADGELLNRLTFLKPRVGPATGNVVITAGAVEYEPDESQISLSDGTLIWTQGAESGIITSLGEEGEFSCERLDAETLEVRVKAKIVKDRDEMSGEREANVRFKI